METKIGNSSLILEFDVDEDISDMKNDIRKADKSPDDGNGEKELSSSEKEGINADSSQRRKTWAAGKEERGATRHLFASPPESTSMKEKGKKKDQRLPNDQEETDVKYEEGDVNEEDYVEEYDEESSTSSPTAGGQQFAERRRLGLLHMKERGESSSIPTSAGDGRGEDEENTTEDTTDSSPAVSMAAYVSGYQKEHEVRVGPLNERTSEGDGDRDQGHIFSAIPEGSTAMNKDGQECRKNTTTIDIQMGRIAFTPVYSVQVMSRDEIAQRVKFQSRSAVRMRTSHNQKSHQHHPVLPGNSLSSFECTTTHLNQNEKHNNQNVHHLDLGIVGERKEEKSTDSPIVDSLIVSSFRHPNPLEEEGEKGAQRTSGAEPTVTTNERAKEQVVKEGKEGDQQRQQRNHRVEEDEMKVTDVKRERRRPSDVEEEDGEAKSKRRMGEGRKDEEQDFYETTENEVEGKAVLIKSSGSHHPPKYPLGSSGADVSTSSTTVDTALYSTPQSTVSILSSLLPPLSSSLSSLRHLTPTDTVRSGEDDDSPNFGPSMLPGFSPLKDPPRTFPSSTQGSATSPANEEKESRKMHIIPESCKSPATSTSFPSSSSSSSPQMSKLKSFPHPSSSCRTSSLSLFVEETNRLTEKMERNYQDGKLTRSPSFNHVSFKDDFAASANSTELRELEAKSRSHISSQNERQGGKDVDSSPDQIHHHHLQRERENTVKGEEERRTIEGSKEGMHVHSQLWTDSEHTSSYVMKEKSSSKEKKGRRPLQVIFITFPSTNNEKGDGQRCGHPHNDYDEEKKSREKGKRAEVRNDYTGLTSDKGWRERREEDNDNNEGISIAGQRNVHWRYSMPPLLTTSTTSCMPEMMGRHKYPPPLDIRKDIIFSSKNCIHALKRTMAILQQELMSSTLDDI